VKTIENLSGHLIKPYQIHGDKSILLVKNDDPRKMEEGEYYVGAVVVLSMLFLTSPFQAVETFGSTGRGRIVEGVR